MKKSAFIAIIVAVACGVAVAVGLLLFFKLNGAHGAEGARASYRPSQVSVARAESSNEGDEAGGLRGAEESRGAQGPIRPAFPLEPGEQALQVLNADINLDGTYDQVCAVSRGSESEIYIVCAIQNPVTTSYTRLAPIRTEVTQRRTLLIYFADVTGRMGNALVYSGMNSRGQQVLGIFSIEEDEAAAGGFRLREMLRLTADGAIQVEEVRRSEAYNRGMAVGESYPVVSYHSVPQGDGADEAFAQIRRTYTWNPSSGVYELSSESLVSAETAGAMVMQRLREGGEEALFRFFKGIWYKADGGSQGLQIGFDLASDEIIFADGQTQEVFTAESVSMRGYGVYLVAQNSLISSIRRLVDIEITGPDEIQVRASDDVRLRIGVDSSWDGAYRRLRGASSPPSSSAARRIAAALEGSEAGWADASGAVYVFSGGTLSIENASGGEREEMKYAIYMMRDAPVMQVKDAEGMSVFYLLREDADGKVAMQEAHVSALEVKATAAPEIELTAIVEEDG